MAPRLSMGAENWNFLKLLRTMVVGALWFCLGLLSIRIHFFGNRIKNYGVTVPKVGRENLFEIYLTFTKKTFFF